MSPRGPQSGRTAALALAVRGSNQLTPQVLYGANGRNGQGAARRADRSLSSIGRRHRPWGGGSRCATCLVARSMSRDAEPQASCWCSCAARCTLFGTGFLWLCATTSMLLPGAARWTALVVLPVACLLMPPWCLQATAACRTSPFWSPTGRHHILPFSIVRPLGRPLGFASKASKDPSTCATLSLCFQIWRLFLAHRVDIFLVVCRSLWGPRNQEP